MHVDKPTKSSSEGGFSGGNRSPAILEYFLKWFIFMGLAETLSTVKIRANGSLRVYCTCGKFSPSAGWIFFPG